MDQNIYKFYRILLDEEQLKKNKITIEVKNPEKMERTQAEEKLEGDEKDDDLNNMRFNQEEPSLDLKDMIESRKYNFREPEREIELTDFVRQPPAPRKDTRPLWLLREGNYIT